MSTIKIKKVAERTPRDMFCVSCKDRLKLSQIKSNPITFTYLICFCSIKAITTDLISKLGFDSLWGLRSFEPIKGVAILFMKKDKLKFNMAECPLNGIRHGLDAGVEFP